MEKRQKMPSTTFRIPETDLIALKALAKKNKRHHTSIIREAVGRYLDKEQIESDRQETVG